MRGTSEIRKMEEKRKVAVAVGQQQQSVWTTWEAAQDRRVK